ncbi:MAG: hypothetical protein ACK5P0_01085 [bacterium]|jgi:hypothetical protein
MAKDPAVLFYTNDFLSGTFTMSNEHVGMYIRLLCVQHQKGKLNEQDMHSICKAYVDDVYCKFKKENGYYFNERMLNEANKRSNYTESRRKNAHAKHMQHHMGNHMENENENENINEINKLNKKEKKVKNPTLDEVRKYCAERNKGVDAERWFNYYESNGWLVGKNKMKNWKAAVHTWEKNNVQPVKSKLVL